MDGSNTDLESVLWDDNKAPCFFLFNELCQIDLFYTDYKMLLFVKLHKHINKKINTHITYEVLQLFKTNMLKVFSYYPSVMLNSFI